MSRACEKYLASLGLRNRCVSKGLPREMAEEFRSWAQKSYATSNKLDELGSLLEKSFQHIAQEHHGKGYHEATKRAVEVVAKANQQIGEPLAGAPVPRTQHPGSRNGGMSS